MVTTTNESAPVQAPDVRLIAFYLPQFHPTPENDRWWGKGFTEWTNVTKAKPLFDGHYQPHLPTDLGFYDLRLREARHEQIALAKQYGIDGFCYHYYWFSGKRLLHKPLDDMLVDPESDMPFALCWANETWTRRWDAAEHDVLIEQKYLPGDDLKFIQSIEPFLRDPRYIRVGDRPLLVVYRPQAIPDPAAWAMTWRKYCREVGIGEIHICGALTHGNKSVMRYGYDSAVEYPPHHAWASSKNLQIDFDEPFSGNVLDYAEVAEAYVAHQFPDEVVFRGVVPSWDNAARTQSRSTVFLNGTPANYEAWLARAIERTTREQAHVERMVFINAWNEWAEGCHLEPDRRYGRGFLEATLRAKLGTPAELDFPDRFVKPAQRAARLRRRRSAVETIRYHMLVRSGPLRVWFNRHPILRGLAIRAMRAVRLRA
jgi:lipopolysaccharide biosynthesis protein